MQEHNYDNCHNYTCRKKCEKDGYINAINDAIEKFLEYGCVCVEWNKGLSKEKLVDDVLRQAMGQAVYILEKLKQQVAEEVAVAENATTNDEWITLPKEAFDRMIARMESESERSYDEEESWFINVRDAARIVFEIAREYSNSEIPNKLLDSLHEKILKSKFAEEVTEAEIDALVGAKMNMSENLTSSEEYCEWMQDDGALDIYNTECGKSHLFIDGDPIDNSYLFCPYCGKEIKVVE